MGKTITESELQRITRNLDKTKAKFSELVGEQKALMSELEENHGCKTVAEAEKLLSKLQKKSKLIDQDITRLYTEIEDNYPELLK